MKFKDTHWFRNVVWTNEFKWRLTNKRITRSVRVSTEITGKSEL